MRLQKYFCCLVMTSLFGCAADEHKTLNMTSAQMNTVQMSLSVISPRDAIVRPNIKKLSASNVDISIAPPDAQKVNFGTYDSLSIAIENDVPNAATLIVRSHVVRTSDGKLVLFYPILSILDSSGAIINTIKPQYEFAFSKDILTNEFILPQSVKYFLIHTAPEFAQYTFLDPQSVNPTPGIFRSIVKAQGGLIGALATDTEKPNKTEDFNLGGGGVINVQYK